MFEVHHTDGEARAGTLSLPSGRTITTPAMLVYTRRGGAPNLTPDLLEALTPRPQALQLPVFSFVNSMDAMQQFPGSPRDYLSLDPAFATVATPRDPGVYEFQGALRQSTDAAASVASYGGAKAVSPEEYMATLRTLGPDAAVLLSDEVPADAKRARAAVAADRTLAWLDRCLAAAAPAAPAPGAPAPPTLFACVQGGTQLDHRDRCATGVAAALPRLAGVCVGGLGTGESPAQRAEIIALSLRDVPADKARMAQGLGCPEDILAAVAQGVDLFDFGYVADATAGGYALCFPIDGGGGVGDGGGGDEEGMDADEAALCGRDDTKMNLWAAAYRLDRRPLVAGCPCVACRDHTRAYLHHLLQAHEMTAQVLLEAHNTTHCLRFFEGVRAAVGAGRLGALRERMAARKARWAAGMAGAAS